MFVLLSACASAPCDPASNDSACHADRLLLQNDMLQAKMIIASGDLDNYDLAQALLDRVATQATAGEVEFYQALLLIHQGPQVSEVLKLLQRSADRGHPHATALLYKINSEPYLLAQADPHQAQAYREAYAELDVAKSGYPSFEQALNLVNRLVRASLQPSHP